ncbi:NhaP-type Na+/H+ or K+/H+ antiporter [Modestobacter sp. DSM 44400]|uniref:cation:proton antiporter n=1 Tax=Modestobacter sp. DSM 44400 TaxID=1550230 RepID=UPI00089D3583|nr:cation:proton antiporter [Modestobacter sp. DSM 44400]SDX50217.1 NhaP-type Na+/H+ or K+/H+ antiporter [Modestobacter sp. DSM 44400]
MSFDVVLAIVAGTLVVLGLTASLAKQYTLSPFLLAVVVGAVLGPQVLDVADPTSGAVDRTTLLEQTSRVALALLVTSIGFRLQRPDVRANGRRVLSLLSIGMLVMWLVSSAGAWLLLGLSWPLALLMGAVLTPTDPAVASTLVQGSFAERMLPQRLRMTLEMESGVNDGLALPFVLLAGFLVADSGIDSVGDLLLDMAREVGIALVLGPVVGVAVGLLTRLARARGAVEETFVPVLAPATSLLVLALAGLLGSSGVLAAFLAGVGMSWTARDPDVRRAVAVAQENFTKVATTVVFLLFGAVLPWSDWATLGASGLVFAAWVLLLRRPLAGLAALTPTRTGRWSVGFLSWFGPLGVGSIYYATYVDRFDLAEEGRFFAVVSLAVAVSMVVHTLTATTGMRWYARSTGSEVPEGQSSDLLGPLP